jgi:hypothetical protein
MQWSADGRSLIYNLGADVWAQPIDGAPAKRLTNFTDGLALYFGISSDGKLAAVTRGVHIRDLVMIDIPGSAHP